MAVSSITGKFNQFPLARRQTIKGEADSTTLIVGDAGLFRGRIGRWPVAKGCRCIVHFLLCPATPRAQPIYGTTPGNGDKPGDNCASLGLESMGSAPYLRIDIESDFLRVGPVSQQPESDAVNQTAGLIVKGAKRFFASAVAATLAHAAEAAAQQILA